MGHDVSVDSSWVGTWVAVRRAANLIHGSTLAGRILARYEREGPGVVRADDPLPSTDDAIAPVTPPEADVPVTSG